MKADVARKDQQGFGSMISKIGQGWTASSIPSHGE